MVVLGEEKLAIFKGVQESWTSGKEESRREVRDSKERRARKGGG